MSPGKFHRKADLYLIGYDVPEVHICMDAWSKTLGSQHRQLGHYYQFVEAMGFIFGKKGELCALLHLLLDLNIIDTEFVGEKIKLKTGVRRNANTQYK